MSLAASGNAQTQRRLREALLLLAPATDRDIRAHEFKNLSLNRANQRFADLLAFCRIVLSQHAPASQRGGDSIFSLLFNMERLFEEFIARMIARHARRLGLEGKSVAAQAAGRYLLQDAAGNKTRRLRPDLVISENQTPQLILDTKWKRLDTPGAADLYQLFTYAEAYNCPDNVLCFPQSDSAPQTAKYTLCHDQTKKIRVEFINLRRDLRKDRDAFLQDLSGILGQNLTP